MKRQTQMCRTIILVFVAFIIHGCGSYVYATMLRHPETGDVHLCRSDNEMDMEQESSSLAQSAHDKCVRQLESLGYQIEAQSDSVEED